MSAESVQVTEHRSSFRWVSLSSLPVWCGWLGLLAVLLLNL